MGYLWEPIPVGDGLFVGAHPCGRWAWNTPCKPSPTGGLLQRQKYGPFKLHRAGSVTRRHGPRLGGRGDRGRFLVFPGEHCLSSRTSIVCRLGWLCLSSGLALSVVQDWHCLSSGLALSVVRASIVCVPKLFLSVVQDCIVCRPGLDPGSMSLGVLRCGSGPSRA